MAFQVIHCIIDHTAAEYSYLLGKGFGEPETCRQFIKTFYCFYGLLFNIFLAVNKVYYLSVFGFATYLKNHVYNVVFSIEIYVLNEVICQNNLILSRFGF